MITELKKISNSLAPLLLSSGYQRKGNKYYRISNGIAYCIYVEHPGLYYAGYYIFPLYIPRDFIVLTYGNRLNVHWNGTGDSTVFSVQIIEGIQDTVLPFFQQIDNAEHLLAFLRQDFSFVYRWFFCPHFEISLLRTYTALMLHHNQEFHFAASETRQRIHTTNSYSSDFVTEIETELNSLEEIESLSEEEIDRHFQTQIAQSLQKFYPKYRPPKAETQSKNQQLGKHEKP